MVTEASTTAYVPWLSPARLPRLRSILLGRTTAIYLGLTLFLGPLVWVAFSLGLTPRGTHLVSKLRAIVIMTWVYALVQIADMKVWHRRFGLVFFVVGFALFPIRSATHH